ncbi:MAG: hypothetical protein ACXAD7_05435 [Candidatus Kariarchaeaceae archaeon]|jgi:hypothetical protein
MNQVSYKTCKKSDIPKYLLPQLAIFIARGKEEQGKEPGHSAEFLLESLQKPLPVQYGQYYSLTLHDKQIIGWGHLSWSKNQHDPYLPEIYIVIKPEERRKGYGTKMFRDLLLLIPPQLDIVTIPAMKGSSGAQFIQTKLNGTIAEEDQRGLLKVRELRSEDVDKKVEYCRQHAEKQGFKIHSITNDYIETDIGIAAFIEFIHQLEHGIKLPVEQVKIKEEEYRAIMEREKRRETQFLQYVALEKETGELVGYTRTAINMEGNKKMSWDEFTGVLPRFKGKELEIAMKYQILKYLTQETEVSHWVAQNMFSNDYLLKINTKLGFEKFLTNCIHEIKRENWEQFLSRNLLTNT